MTHVLDMEDETQVSISQERFIQNESFLKKNNRFIREALHDEVFIITSQSHFLLSEK